MKTSEMPENKEKIKAWQEHDESVPGARVMVRAETWYTSDTKHTVNDSELLCENKWARDLERNIRFRKHEIEVLKDDNFVVPWIEYYPHIGIGDFGIPSGVHHVAGAEAMAFNYRPALKTLDDGEFKLIHHREPVWNREEEEQEREALEEVFKGIIKIRRRISGWQLNFPVTSTAFDFVGLDGFMMLIYDNPEGLHRLMRFIKEDHLLRLKFMEENNLLSLNNEADYIGSGCMGSSRLLPAPDFKGRVRAKDLWYYCESQESVSISPDHFGEFVFPYIKELAEMFGRVYYGCCEPTDPVWKYISTLKNLQRVSISPWAKEDIMGKNCRERKVVYSRKMPPPLFMTKEFNENGGVRKSIEHTVNCAEGARLEFMLRDIYTLRNEPDRFRQWVELVREGGKKHKG
ncbi:MAG: hypothetical protein WCI43_00725 [Candidatus Firestonebacteria bacterium]